MQAYKCEREPNREVHASPGHSSESCSETRLQKTGVVEKTRPILQRHNHHRAEDAHANAMIAQYTATKMACPDLNYIHGVRSPQYSTHDSRVKWRPMIPAITRREGDILNRRSNVPLKMQPRSPHIRDSSIQQPAPHGRKGHIENTQTASAAVASTWCRLAQPPRRPVSLEVARIVGTKLFCGMCLCPHKRNRELK